MEDQVTDPDFGGFLEQPGLPATVNQLGEITFQHDRAAAAGLGRFGAESDRPGVPVHVGPLQGDDLALPPAREVGEPGEVLQVGGQGSDHGFQVRPLEEALPGVVLRQRPHLRDGRQQLPVVSEAQAPAKQLQLPVDGRVGLLVLPARGDVGLDRAVDDVHRAPVPEVVSHGLEVG